VNDEQVLILMARLIDTDPAAADALHAMWKQQQKSRQALETIRDWDMLHDEALTLTRVQQIVADAL